MGWRANKAWSDRFVPQIQQILAEHLVTVAEPEEDAQHNTDLFTLQLPGQVRIACRVRRHEYLLRYPDEFTLRCSVPSGSNTEIDKLVNGWGDLLFYGFANAEETELAAWLLGDLQVFREWLASFREVHRKWPCRFRKNRDGSSAFLVFQISDVDPRFVMARQAGPRLAA